MDICPEGNTPFGYLPPLKYAKALLYIKPPPPCCTLPKGEAMPQLDLASCASDAAMRFQCWPRRAQDTWPCLRARDLAVWCNTLTSLLHSTSLDFWISDPRNSALEKQPADPKPIRFKHTLAPGICGGSGGWVGGQVGG